MKFTSLFSSEGRQHRGSSPLLPSHADCGNKSLSDGCKAEGGNFLQPGENMDFHKAVQEGYMHKYSA